MYKLVITPSKKDLGLAFKANQKIILEALDAMSEPEALEMKSKLESNGEAEFEVCTLNKTVIITSKMISINMEKKKVYQRVFTPSVIEPSFGIGRIIYCIYEHVFYTREGKMRGEQLNVFGFPPIVAPKKCAVFSLVKNEEFDSVARDISKALRASRIPQIIDVSGKKYARSDEMGVPLAVTVDSTASVTVRERDSRSQIRVKVAEVVTVVKRYVEGQSTWGDI